MSERWPIFVAGKALVSAGQFDEAVAVADQLDQMGELGVSKQLRHLVKRARQPRLGSQQ